MWKGGFVNEVATSAAVRALTVVMAAATLYVAGNAKAEESTVASVQAAGGAAVNELEKAFWLCDWAATTNRIDDQQAIMCGKITSDLKDQKFGGDFDRLVAWWREHKSSEHRKLALTREQES